MFRKRLALPVVVSAVLLGLLGTSAYAGGTVAQPVPPRVEGQTTPAFPPAAGVLRTKPSQQLAPAFPAECPQTITCIVKPAAQAMNGGNPGDYGNYDVTSDARKTSRPKYMPINAVVIHDTEGTYDATVEWFQYSGSYAAAHYVVNTDGTVTQMVPLKDMPWHAGNWWYNMHTVGIEVVGFSAEGSTYYTPKVMRAVAELTKYLTTRFSIPRDRAHIIGHENVPAPETRKIVGMHTDPGPFWNWEQFMSMIGAPIQQTGGLTAPMVTVAPKWTMNKQPVTGCWNTHCAPTTPSSTNFVYLRTAPNVSAPLLADAVLGQGTTELQSNAARAFYGQKFAVKQFKLDQTGMWYQVWYGGQLGWIYSPWVARTVLPTSGKVITPKVGRTSIPVYGRPAPDLSEYPSDFVAPPGLTKWYAEPLSYTIAAGQQYALLDTTNPTDNFYAWNIASEPGFDKYDSTVFRGGKKYYLIDFGAGRQGFVNAADVIVR